MKLLWVKSEFLHPTNRGSQIRSLEMLRRLHLRHEVHYAGLTHPDRPEEGLPEARQEYASHVYSIPHYIPDRTSWQFIPQLVGGLVSDKPVAVSRFNTPRMTSLVEQLLARENFDRVVVDHLAPSGHYPDMGRSLMFQHNVESVIWKRHAEEAHSPLKRFYLDLQYRKMLDYEGKACRAAGHVCAVSPLDAQLMKDLYGLKDCSSVPTGVNIDYFTPKASHPRKADLVFVGSMEWLPNVYGAEYFVTEILPLIRRHKPDCTLALAGRKPTAPVRELAERDPLITVTGTVDDIRPWLWGSSVSIVPLKIGGGTRLKIYEAMAARVPVVSTTIGAEGLDINPPHDIRIGDTPEEFAAHCVELLKDAEANRRVAEAAYQMVCDNFSWEQVTRVFERALEKAPPPR